MIRGDRFPPILLVLGVHKPLAQETNAEDETRKSGATCFSFRQCLALLRNSPVFVCMWVCPDMKGSNIIHIFTSLIYFIDGDDDDDEP